MFNTSYFQFQLITIDVNYPLLHRARCSLNLKQNILLGLFFTWLAGKVLSCAENNNAKKLREKCKKVADKFIKRGWEKDRDLKGWRRERV
jgi:hypothetical protein